jgi:hypothetical protein
MKVPALATLIGAAAAMSASPGEAGGLFRRPE